MQKGTINVYKNDCTIVKIPEVHLNFTEDKKLPCFCSWAGDSLMAIATEYIKDEKAYLVDISTNKVFSCTSFKSDELPTHLGMPIYVTQKGVMTGKKEGNMLAGQFLGMQNEAVLFKLN